jgi:hypothetical protein
LYWVFSLMYGELSALLGGALGGLCGTLLGATVSAMVSFILLAHPNLFYLRISSLFVSFALVVALLRKDSGSKSYPRPSHSLLPRFPFFRLFCTDGGSKSIHLSSPFSPVLCSSFYLLSSPSPHFLFKHIL